jgi:cation transporter-like permease
MKNKILSFWENIEWKSYKVLDERVLRGSAWIMFLLWIIAFINGFVLQNYIVIPYISWFLLLNFLIGVFINPKFAPTMFISKLITLKQNPLYVWAIQKRFAWSLGILLATFIFWLSFKLITDIKFFPPVCMLCLICLILLYLETAFGICVWCKLYFLAIRLRLIKKPKETPNCIGDSCEI